MNLPAAPSLRLSENGWRATILTLSAAVLILTVWCLANGITTVFMHLYYFPIVLLAYRYRWRGFGFAALLTLAYLALSLFFSAGQPEVIAGALYRSLAFVGIAGVIAWLSYRLGVMEDSLQTAGELRERYISLAPAIILALDREGRVTRLNEKGCSILGWSPRDVEGKPWVDIFIPPDDRRNVRTLFEQIIHGEIGGNDVVETNILRADGSVRVIRWHNTLIRGSDGSITGTLSYGEDITEDKRVRDNLRKLQQFQESVITNANVWISVLAPDGTILVWNDAAESISGYKKDEVVGKNTVWKQLYPDKNVRRKITGDIQRIIGRDQFLENFETEIYCADGSVKTIVWNTRGLRDRDGAITSYIAIGRDISVQKAAEMRAAESARFLGTMIDALPIPIFFKDTEGKFLGCNPPFEEFTGTKQDQLVGKTAYDVAPKDLADGYTEGDRQVLENTAPLHYETQVQYTNGIRHDVILYKAPFFNKDGSPGGLIGAYLDITERKQVEKDLIFKNALFSAENEVSLDGILIVDEHQQILLTNHRFLEMWDLPPAMAAGGTDAPVLDHVLTKIADREAFLQKVQDLYEHPDRKSRDEIVLTDGRIFDRYSAPVVGSDAHYYGRIWYFRDITDTRVAEEAIRQASREWQTTFNAINDVVFLLDGEGTIVRHNRAFELFTGKTAREIEGKHCHEILHGTAYPRVGCPNVEARKSRHRESIELMIHDRWYVATVDPIIAEDDSVSGAVHLIIDITERKRAEERLRESEKKFHDIFDNINDAIELHVFQPNGLPGRYLDVNDVGCRMLNYTRTELLTISPLDIVTDYHNPPLDEIAIELNTKGSSRFETGHRRKDGTIVPVEVNAHVTHLQDQDVVVAVVRDITERKQAEEEIKRSVERFRVVMDSIDALVYVVDMQTYELLFINKYGRDMWGKEIEGKVCWQTIQSGQDGPCPFCTNARLVDDKGNPTGIYNWEFRNTINGRWFDCRDLAIRWLDGRLVRLEIATDITGRKQTEADLRESRQLLEGVLDTIPVRVFWKDTNLIFLGCNTAFANDAGFERSEDIIGKDDFAMGWRDQAENYRSDDQAVIDSRKSKILIEEPQTTPSGETMYLLTSKVPLLDARGDVIGVLGTYLDITGRKKMEQELLASRQLFADIISFLPDPTFVIDRDGRVLAWNRAIEVLSGVSAEDIIGKGDHEYSQWMYGKRRPILIDLVLHPDEDAGRLDYSNIHWERRSVTAQAEITRPGTERKVTLSLVVSPLMDAEGKITGAIESMRDISRLKEAEAELACINRNLESIVRDRTRALEEEVAQRVKAENEVLSALSYTRSVIEANPDLMAVLDRHGTILDVNAAAEALTGLARNQLTGTSYFSYLADDSSRQGLFSRLLEEGQVENNIQIRRADGHLTPVAVKATVIGVQNAPDARIIVAGHDITRQKQDEAVIKASLEEKVILLREIHHRVKNNLQIIISLTNLQMRQTEDPAVKLLMAETQNRVRAMSLVHEKLYRSESLSQIDFADYTRFLATQLFSFFGIDTRRVHIDLALRRIMVDINTAVPLGLIMNELISNALKHAFPGERQGTISISGGYDGDLITLIVRDNGVGIPADFDWKNTTSLGMRLVNSLIEQVDGTLTLDRGTGTTFTVTVKKEPGSRGEE